MSTCYVPVAAGEVGRVAVLIDAKNERVAGWYGAFGALPLLDAPRALLLPLASIEVGLKVSELQK